MLPFRKITFPVDFSDTCQAAVPYVREMVNRYGAQLSIVHAFGWAVIESGDLVGEVPMTLDRWKAADEQRLREFAEKAFPGLKVDLSMKTGEPGNIINDWVAHQQSDLVMLPTHGRGPVRRLLLGSTTAKVLHDLSVAVWTAKPDILANPPKPCRSVLCACDLGDPAEARVVLKAASSIARQYGADLSILHAIPLVPMPLEVDYASLRQALIEAAEGTLREMQAELGITAPYHITDGPVPAAVVDHAERLKAGLIVAGRGHQQNTFGRIWSSLYEIVREAPCPVISI